MRTRMDQAVEVRATTATSTYGGVERIEELKREWRSLCDEGPCSDPFFRPEWIRAHLRSFEPEAKLRIVEVRSGGRLRLLLPLVQERSRLRGFPVRKLRAPAGVHSCRFDLVYGGGDLAPLIDAAWDHLKDQDGWDVIELRDVQEGGAAERLLDAARKDRNYVGRWESMRTPYIPLTAGGLDEVLSRADTHFRANLRRRMRKLEQKGKVSLRRIADADPQALAAFYALERDGWKGSKGSAIDCDPKTRAFYDEIAAWAAEEGTLSLYALELDGEPVAMHFGLTAGGRYFVPKPAFASAHKECSPGQLLIQEVLRDCASRGQHELDFLGPSMAWKQDWTKEERSHGWCYVFRRGPLGAALHSAKFGLGKLREALRGR